MMTGASLLWGKELLEGPLAAAHVVKPHGFEPGHPRGRVKRVLP